MTSDSPVSVPITDPAELMHVDLANFGDTVRALAAADGAYADYRAGRMEVEDATRALIDLLGLAPLAAWQALNADESPSRTYLAQMDARINRPSLSDGGADQ